MNTPLFDFVRRYAEGETARLHMPGHKGCGVLGFERYDITELAGADSLYEADGIIRESEENASRLFASRTFYTTEGSSHAIRAMLFLAMKEAGQKNRPLRIAAARNVHKSFLTAAALLDLETVWLSGGDSYLSCALDLCAVEDCLVKEHPFALYVTSPDYLGNLQDIAALAELCHHHGALLLVDNAHGAYLRFLPASQHPIDLGADMCCDSAHKTLPALTGAAYLHIGGNVAATDKQVKEALALFGSTSPSYLTLVSLDALNLRLATDYPVALASAAKKTEALKTALATHGYPLIGDEPLKITLSPKQFGYTGTALAALLREKGIEPEFADPDYLVLMPSAETSDADFARIGDALCSVKRRVPIAEIPPAVGEVKTRLSVRAALFAETERIPTEKSQGRIFASLAFSCPPAVPVLAAGEEITEEAIRALLYYGIETVTVVK